MNKIEKAPEFIKLIKTYTELPWVEETKKKKKSNSTIWFSAVKKKMLQRKINSTYKKRVLEK